LKKDGTRGEADLERSRPGNRLLKSRIARELQATFNGQRREIFKLEKEKRETGPSSLGGDAF